ncbi:MAG TPA: IclR family transcriptional regulator [Syntrophorhabdaceae bacterium]|nr:IclR family transcriptional regulator [Syntrophorhabdaceae bacterium]
MFDAKKNPRTRYKVPAVEQSSRVLFTLADTQSSHLSLNEICAKAGLHKSRAFAILETLQTFGLVQRNCDGQGYALGPALISLSRKVLDDMSPARLAEPILKDLAKKTGSTAILGLIAGSQVFVAAKHEGEGNIGLTMRIGHRLPLTYGAHGKAIAAHLLHEDLDGLLQEGDNRFYGDPAKFDRERLNDDLEKCRSVGFAEDLGQASQGLNVVAAPVLDARRIPIGYIEIFVLFSSKEAHRFGPVVAKSASELSRLLGSD